MTKRERSNRFGKAVASGLVLGMVAVTGFACGEPGQLEVKGKVGTARFKIDANDCTPGQVNGTINYKDHAAHVRFNAPIFFGDLCSQVEGCEDRCAGTDLLFVADYGPDDVPSTSHLVGVCLGDNGDGETGSFLIAAIGGVHDGYEYSGTVNRAKVDYGPCD